MMNRAMRQSALPVVVVVALAGCAGNRPPPVAQYEYVAPVLPAPETVAPSPAPPRRWHLVPQAEAAPPRTFDPPPHLPPQPIDPSGSYDCVGWWRLCHLWSGS